MFEVASSRTRMRGSASSARAIEMSCRSPAERPGAALAHRVLQAAREPRRNTVDADGGGRSLDLLVGRVGLREADVRGDRAAEEERILEHDAQLAPVRAELDVAQVVPVHAHRSLVGVVVAADQPCERRLAVARLADEREAAARRDVERDSRAGPGPCRRRRRPSRSRGRPRGAAAAARRAGRGSRAPRRGCSRSSPSPRRPTAAGRRRRRAPAAAGRRAAGGRSP